MHDGEDVEKIAPSDKEAPAHTGEASQGFLLWHGLHRVISLTVNIRAPGVLGRLQTEMRAGQISEEEASADRSGLFENVKRVHEINRAVRTGACPCQRARRHSHSARRLTARSLRWTASRSSAATQR